MGSTYRAPGERAGGHFGKTYEIILHVGDVIRIPAAVPHEVVDSGNQPLEYLLIKQREAGVACPVVRQPMSADTRYASPFMRL